jgi:hypothetical protein
LFRALQECGKPGVVAGRAAAVARVTPTSRDAPTSAGERYKRTGEILPDSALEEFKKFDSIFLGRGGYRLHPREMIAEIRDKGRLDLSHFLVIEGGNDVTTRLSHRSQIGFGTYACDSCGHSRYLATT